MRKLMLVAAVLCVVTLIVAVAFAQGQGRQGQGRRGGGQTPSMMTTAFADGKIYALKDNVLFKINASDMKVEKKKKLELPQEDEQTARFMRSRMTLTIEGKSLFLVSFNVIHKVDLDSLEVKGSLKADDLTPPEEEKKEGEEEKGGGGDF